MSNIRLLLLIVSISLAAVTSTVYAVPQATDSDKQVNTSKAEPGKNVKKEDESSEVERIVKLEATLKANKKSIQKLKKSLSGRSKILKTLQDALNKATITLEKHKERLAAAKEKGDAKKIASIEKAISKYQSDYDLIVKQTQLAFEAEKTAKKQIELLENGIQKKQQTLDELKGIKKRVVVTPKQIPAPTAVTPAQQPQEAPKPAVTSLIPGLAPVPVDSAAPTSMPTPVEHMQTAEQVEARKQAEKRTQEAFEAEQVAIDYIEQKATLVEGIKLAQTLLTTDMESLDNFNKILLTLKNKLIDAEKTGASNEKLEKIKQDIKLVNNEVKNLNQEITKRKAIIAAAQEEIESLKEDQELLAKEAQEKREQAEKAQKRVIWLQSPLHPQNLLTWVITRGPRVILVLILMFVLLSINNITAKRISSVLARRSGRMGEMSQNRANTLALSFRGAIRVLIVFGGVVLALQEAGVDIKTVLGGAAILGVAIAFGAQNLMRDYFNGFMILLEDQYELSDIVTINNITGTVERVSMRSTMLRDLNGQAHFIPNGSITLVTNSTYEWARAVIEVPVAYKENVDRVMSVILELANELRKDSEFGSDIQDDAVMLGVNSFDESAVNIKFMLQTRADRMWPVRREMLRRIKNRFDELGIEFAHPQRIITQRPSVEAS